VIGMNYNFDKFFPTIQLIGIGIMLITCIVIIVIAFRMIKDRNSRNSFLWGLALLLFTIGIVVNSRTKYVVKDYIENKDYILVVAKIGLLKNTYIPVDYKDYWKDMNWNTYRIDYQKKVIYMRTNRFY